MNCSIPTVAVCSLLSAAALAAETGASIGTEDGLSLRLGEHGQVAALRLEWNEPAVLARFRDKHALKAHVREVRPDIDMTRVWRVSPRFFASASRIVFTAISISAIENCECRAAS